MAVSLIKTARPTTAPVEEAVDADQLGNDILLAAAGGESTTTVAGSRSGWMQSHTSRAWTRGGQVD